MSNRPRVNVWRPTAFFASEDDARKAFVLMKEDGIDALVERFVADF